MILRAITVLLLAVFFLSGISSPAFSATTEDNDMNIATVIQSVTLVSAISAGTVAGINALDKKADKADTATKLSVDYLAQSTQQMMTDYQIRYTQDRIISIERKQAIGQSHQLEDREKRDLEDTLKGLRETKEKLNEQQLKLLNKTTK